VSNVKTFIIALLITAGVFIGGFFVGKNNVVSKIIPGKTIVDTVKIPEPYPVVVRCTVKVPTFVETNRGGDTVRFMTTLDTLRPGLDSLRAKIRSLTEFSLNNIYSPKTTFYVDITAKPIIDKTVITKTINNEVPVYYERKYWLYWQFGTGITVSPKTIYPGLYFGIGYSGGIF